MSRFARLALVWLGLGVLATLVAIQLKATSGSVGSSPVQNPGPNNGRSAPTATLARPAPPVVRQALASSPPALEAPLDMTEPAWSSVPVLLHGPCLGTFIPSSIQSSTMTLTLAGTSASVTVTRQAQQSAADVHVETPAVLGVTGAIDTGLGQQADGSLVSWLNVSDLKSGAAPPQRNDLVNLGWERGPAASSIAGQPDPGGAGDCWYPNPG